MTPAEQINQLLTGDATVATATGSRIYPVRAAQDAPVPYINYFDVYGAPDNHLGGWSGLDHIRLQVSVWHDNYLQMQALKLAVREALTQSNATFTAVCMADFDGPVDSGVILYHRILEFSLWTR